MSTELPIDLSVTTPAPTMVSPANIALPPSPRHCSEQEVAQEDAGSENASIEAGAEDDDDEDVLEDTTAGSTYQNDHEPLETFKDKVIDLFASHFPDKDPRTFQVERIKGGSYNRIIGVTIKPPKVEIFTWEWIRQAFQRMCGTQRVKKEEQYIIRIPRIKYDGDEMKYDVAVLEFAASRLPFPIPRIQFVDYTSENALGSPYTIQPRLSGANLAAFQTQLSVEQNVKLTRYVMDIHRGLQSLTSATPGIVLPETSTSSALPLTRFLIPEHPKPEHEKFLEQRHATLPAVPQTTRDLLLELCVRNEVLEETTQDWAWPLWHQFKQITQHLHARGFLPDDELFHFCHLDLYGRNMLAHVDNDRNDIDITGVLDWDMEYACFAPKFVTHKAPFWLWVTDDENDENEDFADTISDPEKASLVAAKRIFDETAGDEWKRFAYTPEYQIARSMFEVMKSGICSSVMQYRATEVVRRWKEIYPEDELPEYPDSSDDEESDSDSHSGAGSDSDDGEEDRMDIDQKDGENTDMGVEER